ncbi:MAG: butyrate kinase [Clostridiales bacterium]|nr:butyrate kinase [Clostridiales bacterium]
MKILALNLGSTSTKLGVFEGVRALATHSIRHPREELAAFPGILAQEGYRRERLLAWLAGQGHSPAGFDAIAARGGLVRPLPGGTFLVDQAVCEDARSGRHGLHPANVGLLIAHSLSQEYQIPAYFTDAPTTDELVDVARVSGYAGISRRSIFHALNIKRVARLQCDKLGLRPQDSRFIAAHMGGGITVAALRGLKALDLNNGVDGEGPFTPERAGHLPTRALLDCLEGSGHSPGEMSELLYRQGGLQSYFGTNDVGALVARAQAEAEVRLVLDAMVYQVAKQIAALAVPLGGRVDGILLTGGIAHNAGLMDSLASQVGWIAPVSVYPGEDELQALAEGAWRVLSGQEQAGRLDG